MSIITAILLSDELKSRHQRAAAAARPPASGAIGITIMGRAELVLEITRVSWLSAAPASIRAWNVDEVVGFDELRWLQELAHRVRPKQIPAPIGIRLVMRGLIEEKAGTYTLTARGRIALSKLG